MFYFSEYEECRLCGRDCRINRNQGEKGFCGQDARLKIAQAGLHFGEEPFISGKGGSGTIFFSGCSMGCAYCQNYQISQESLGFYLDEKALSSIMLRLQQEGAENINLVTGNHFWPQIKAALTMARQKGLKLPIVWNSSGLDTLPWREDVFSNVDIYLADLKSLDSQLCTRLFNLPNYPEIAAAALLDFTNRKKIIYDDKAMMRQGCVTRHLVLPGELESTEKVLAWFKKNLEDKAELSLMTQFVPAGTGKNSALSERTLNQFEYQQILNMLEKYEIESGLIQDLNDDLSWLPDFKREKSFPSPLSRTIWQGRFLN